MLDDTAFDIQSWLADEIAMEFARAEGAAFVNGGAATGLGRTASTRRWSNRPRPTCWLMAHRKARSRPGRCNHPAWICHPTCWRAFPPSLPALRSACEQVTYAVSAPLNLFPNPSFRKESSR